jgi:hypothetical protein
MGKAQDVLVAKHPKVHVPCLYSKTRLLMFCLGTFALSHFTRSCDTVRAHFEKAHIWRRFPSPTKSYFEMSKKTWPVSWFSTVDYFSFTFHSLHWSLKSTYRIHMSIHCILMTLIYQQLLCKRINGKSQIFRLTTKWQKILMKTTTEQKSLYWQAWSVDGHCSLCR